MSDGVIKITHNEVEITYLETPNEWEFQLRGRTRTAPTLTKAKEAIDKEPASSRKPFARFEAWMMGHYGDDQYRKVTVTSYAGKNHTGDEWWVNKGSKISRWDHEREKVSGSDLIVISDSNLSKFDEIKSLDIQKAALKNKRDQVVDSLERIQPTKEMADA